MTPQENETYDGLPDSVTCFRGCDQSFLTGASWSSEWDTANSFPFTDRYRAPSPVVVTARVKKNRILAMKLDRRESEIITFSARRVKVEPADADRAKAYHAVRCHKRHRIRSAYTAKVPSSLIAALINLPLCYFSSLLALQHGCPLAADTVDAMAAEER